MSEPRVIRPGEPYPEEAAELATMSDLAIPGALTETSLDLPAGLPFERWQECGLTLKRIDQSVKWWVGDWLNYGEANYPERWAQAIEVTEYDRETLRKAAWVAARVPRGTRRESLPYRHHEVVASLPPEEQERWLDASEPRRKGEAPVYSSRELREAIRNDAEPKAEAVKTRPCEVCNGTGEVPVE